MPAPPWRSRNRKLATLSRLADQRGAQPMQISPEGLEWMSPRSRSTLHRRQGGEPAPEIQVDPAAFVFHKTERLTICFFL